MKVKLSKLLSPYDTVSIIGMSKNAGKTTVLNRLIAEYRKRGVKIGLTSIGRDGENVDVVTSTDKPEIYVTKGTLIATAADLLKKSDITKEIMQTTGINTPMGEVVFARAMSDGYVQIGGGSINSQIVRICGDFKDLGAEKVLIDGAISRKAVSSPGVADAAILCAGASLSADIDKVADDTAFAADILMLRPLEQASIDRLIEGFPESAGKVAAILPDGEVLAVNPEEPLYIGNNISYIYIRGAVSDRVIDKLIMSNINLKNAKIIADDGSKLFIKRPTLEKLKRRGSDIIVRRSINLVALAINPVSAYGFNFDKNDFMEIMRGRVTIPVVNVLDEER
jgi:molybdopterin-guanine dinucleotide biosynthesis protein